jgi:hypothetical protein
MANCIKTLGAYYGRPTWFEKVFPSSRPWSVDYQKLVQQIYKCVAKFRNVGTVGQKAGSGAPKKRIPEIVADVSARMKQSPKKKNLTAG